MVCGSQAKTRAMYSTPPCPSLATSTAAYRRRSFSDSQPKNRFIFCSTSAAYTSMPHSLIRGFLCRKDTAAQAIREVILDHILRRDSCLHNTLAFPSAFRSKGGSVARFFVCLFWAKPTLYSTTRGHRAPLDSQLFLHQVAQHGISATCPTRRRQAHPLPKLLRLAVVEPSPSLYSTDSSRQASYQ
jgi:hypothetical protein